MVSTLTKTALAYLGALATTFVLASLGATQSVLARVRDMGLPVGFDQHVATSLHDLAGMTTLLLPLIGVALLIGFGVAALLVRRFGSARLTLYALAGGCAMWALHTLLTLTLDITPVAAARTAAGLIVQSAAGAVGGAVFALLKKVPA